MAASFKIASVARPQAVVVGWFEKTEKLPADLAALDKKLSGVLSDALARSEFKAERGSILSLYPRTGSLAGRVIVVGLGAEDRVNADVLRLAGAKIARALAAAEVSSVQIRLAGTVGKGVRPEQAGRAIGDGLTAASFEFNTFKSAASNGQPKKATVISVDIDAAWKSSADRALKIGPSMNLARELAATPPNVANPAYVVNFCKSMAKKVGLSCKIIDAKQAKKLGMGAFLAVGNAGSTPPALIVLEWKGKKSTKPVLLVGKAVTFDTGGYSLKPTDSMVKMKYDKCGGMAVIGALHAAATMKLPVHVVGVIPTVENLISDKAYRPDDILTCCNGVTVEITNTDAEGRLILADALAYGCKTFKPSAVIDLATLTGGVVVALGSQAAGMFCNQPPLRDHLEASGEFVGERLWTLPLWPVHKELMKGTHSDIVNSSPGREAHAIQGAVFLSYFAGKDGKPRDLGAPGEANMEPAWAHLDIAGVADSKKDLGPFSPGPTGFGVRLLVRVLETWE